MKVNSGTDISFKNIYTNKAFKKGLEVAADNGALFGAAATVAFSVARPLSIWLTPKTDKENRLLAISKSLSSSIINFLLTLGITLPLAKSIKKIDKKPDIYLNKETIKFLKDTSKNLYESKGYTFATQLFKLGIGVLIAIPKSIMVAAGMPYISNSIEDRTNIKDKSSTICFEGKPVDKLAKKIGKTIEKKGFRNFIEKYKDTNFPMHIVAATDAISTAAFIHQTQASSKIKEDRKNALIYNSVIATTLSIGAGYILDSLLDKPTEKFIEKYKIANKFDKNLKKQVQGIKIAKPFLILGSIYYILIPFISTFLAEKADKKSKLNLYKC